MRVDIMLLLSPFIHDQMIQQHSSTWKVQMLKTVGLGAQTQHGRCENLNFGAWWTYDWMLALSTFICVDPARCRSRKKGTVAFFQQKQLDSCASFFCLLLCTRCQCTIINISIVGFLINSLRFTKLKRKGMSQKRPMDHSGSHSWQTPTRAWEVS